MSRAAQIPRLSHLPRRELESMAAAGREVARLDAEMESLGGNPHQLLTKGDAVAFRHYPVGDVYDVGSHSQFYYHCHRSGETGHFHLFLRPRGMPAGLCPLAPKNAPADAPAHLIAVGLDSAGRVSQLFTTNRWVTGEAWYAAADVRAMLPRFRIWRSHVTGVDERVGRWLTALVGLFAPLIGDLLDERDRMITELIADAARIGRPAPLEDEGVEVLSRTAVSVENWRMAVEVGLREVT